MAEIGKSKGADPTEWYATFSPISINNLGIEVYENGEWYNLKKEGGEFDSDLFNRNLEKTFVFKQGKEMEEKMLKEQQANQPIAVKKDNESNAPIEEKVVEKEVAEEKVVDAQHRCCIWFSSSCIASLSHLLLSYRPMPGLLHEACLKTG